MALPKKKLCSKSGQNAIPRLDKKLDKFSTVCEQHFDERFIERNYSYMIDGKEVLLPRTKPVLLPDAVPTIFPNLPQYLTKKLPPKRNPKGRESGPPSKKIKLSLEVPACTSNLRKNSDIFNNTANLDVSANLDNVCLPSKYWSKINLPNQNVTLFASYETFSYNSTDVCFSVCMKIPFIKDIIG